MSFMDATHQDHVHAMTGLFPGDYFIHEFEMGGKTLFAYGLLHRIDDGQQYHADYQCSAPPSQPTSIEKKSHRVVGRINRRAFELARMRGWPNSPEGVDAIIRYAAGQQTPLTLIERLRLSFIKS